MEKRTTRGERVRSHLFQEVLFQRRTFSRNFDTFFVFVIVFFLRLLLFFWFFHFALTLLYFFFHFVQLLPKYENFSTHEKSSTSTSPPSHSEWTKPCIHHKYTRVPGDHRYTMGTIFSLFFFFSKWMMIIHYCVQSDFLIDVHFDSTNGERWCET